MILFRTSDCQLLVRNPNEQFFTDRNFKRYYINSDGQPVDEHGIVTGSAVEKFHYTIDEYIQAFPKAEEYRLFLTDRRGRVAIVQSLPPWAWMPGNVIIMTVYPEFVHPVNPRYSTKPCIVVNDGDDTFVRRLFETEAEANRVFDELLALAPFIMCDLREFGFAYD